MENSGATKWVRIGDYVSEYNVLNTDNKIKIVKSVSVFKEFRDTGAKVDKNELRKYKIVLPGMMSYVQTTKNEKCFACCVNHFDYPIVVTSVNKVLSSNNPEILNIDYLFLILSRNEFDRFAIFNSWGSAREVFQWEDLMNVQIPLPSIEVQKELVEVYNGLKTIAEQNEALAERISSACHAYIVDCRSKYPAVPLGDYITESDERNSDLAISLSQGISNLKEFQFPKQVAQNSKSDKIVRHGYFGYNRATTRNGEKISIAYRDGEDCTVSSAYGVFYINDKSILNPHFLMLFFKRAEFDRYARWRSEGSAHEFFTFDMMKNVKIPVPPIEVQKAIIDVYQCAESAKKIAADAREKLKNLCPALVQRAANS